MSKIARWAFCVAVFLAASVSVGLVGWRGLQIAGGLNAQGMLNGSWPRNAFDDLWQKRLAEQGRAVQVSWDRTGHASERLEKLKDAGDDLATAQARLETMLWPDGFANHDQEFIDLAGELAQRDPDNAMFLLYRAQGLLKDGAKVSFPADGDLYTEYQWGDTRQRISGAVLEVHDSARFREAMSLLKSGSAKEKFASHTGELYEKVRAALPIHSLADLLVWNQSRLVGAPRIYPAYPVVMAANGEALRLAKEGRFGEADQLLLQCARISRFMAEDCHEPFDILVAASILTSYVQSPKSIIAGLRGNDPEKQRWAMACEMSLIFNDNLQQSHRQTESRILPAISKYFGAYDTAGLMAGKRAEYAAADQIGLTMPLAITLLVGFGTLVTCGLMRLKGHSVPLVVPTWWQMLLLIMAAGAPWAMFFYLAHGPYAWWRDYSVLNAPWTWLHYGVVTVVSLVVTRHLARRYVRLAGTHVGCTEKLPRPGLIRRALHLMRWALVMTAVAVFFAVLLGVVLLILGDISYKGLSWLHLAQVMVVGGLTVGIVWAVWRRLPWKDRQPVHGRPTLALSVVLSILMATLVVQVAGVMVLRRAEAKHAKAYVAAESRNPRDTWLGPMREWVLNELDEVDAELRKSVSRPEATATR